MDLSQFDYDLPESLIAQYPADRRDKSRLLVADRDNHMLYDRYFFNIEEYFQPEDVLVLNDTYVFPARLFGKKQPGGADIEMLLLEQKSHDQWEVIAYRASRLKTGTRVVFSPSLECEVIKPLEEGKFIVRFEWHGQWEEILKEIGEIPLPPYISREKGKQTATDRERYQTIYAKKNQQLNSSAAPTAGLHFTDPLLSQLQDKGVKIAYVTLRVGLDTFLPLRTDNITEHKMHSESYFLPPSTAETIENAHKKGNKIIAVGTTAMRVLESAAREPGKLVPGENSTNLFIYPGYKFNIVNTMVTNFHLPRTTLILLVSAFMGNEFRHQAYQHAINESYRFYSYGDAMLIL